MLFRSQFVHLKLHKRLHNNERPFICGSCNKSYISASGLRTHWKTTKCEPSPAEEAITAERSLFLLQQNDQNFINFNNSMFKYEHGKWIKTCSMIAFMIGLFLDSDSNPVGSPSTSEADGDHGDLVMDVEDGDKRFSVGHDQESDTEQEQEMPGRSYTVTSLPASEHAELAKAVLSSTGPKINCPVPSDGPTEPSAHCDVWPADHTAIC